MLCVENGDRATEIFEERKAGKEEERTRNRTQEGNTFGNRNGNERTIGNERI